MIVIYKTFDKLVKGKTALILFSSKTSVFIFFCVTKVGNKTC